jgi:hypothetical protein
MKIFFKRKTKQIKLMSEIVLKNPITNSIKKSIINCSNCLNIAVPFISGFAKCIINNENTENIVHKKIITRFEDSYINSFDLPTLRALLDLGFEIRFDNTIHLKLYIADKEGYVTSSNFTKGGFEDNIELTIKIDEENTEKCKQIFDEIWDKCEHNNISHELINSNVAKYELLKKRDNYLKIPPKSISTQEIPVGIDVQDIIDSVFNQRKDYSNTLQLQFNSNKLREEFKRKLKKGFDSKIFYVPQGHSLRNQTLFYEFIYGYESKLAGTGLRESHFESAFLHSDFEKVINYIFPEMIGLPPWNFQDEKILKEFCNGIFDFDIPCYKEILPIRLATYFYPDLLLPIFKLDHLKETCCTFGYRTDAQTKGDKLFSYNWFLIGKMKSLPFGNIIKGYTAYQVKFTIELLRRLRNETYEAILSSYKEVWKKDFINEGKHILINLKLINL